MIDKLKPHQEEAHKAVLEEFKDADRATVVMPCGSGKSWVGSSVASAMKPESVIALFPSLALLSQALNDWKNNKPFDEGFDYLCVCSDPTVAGDDQIVVRNEDIGALVSTSPRAVTEFLSAPGDLPKVVFSTYQSANVVGEGMPEGFRFDYGLFDEAHKTAGAESKQFSYALDDARLPIEKRLFMTATPRHFLPNMKNREGDMETAYSMDDESVYGKKVYTLSHREAIRRGIIVDYKILISVVTSEMVAGWLQRHEASQGGQTNARAIASMIAMQKAVEQYEVKKIFSFHARVDDARAFKESRHVAECLPKFETLHVNGEQTAQERKETIETFKNAKHGGLLTNAKCLTEGVDVPSVDMVAFMSPKKSTVDIVQAAGRATRTHERKKIGYILVPLFVEISRDRDESINEALSRSDFTTVIDVLEAMKEQDEAFYDVLTTMRGQRAKSDDGTSGGKPSTGFGGHVEIIDDSVNIADIRAGITTRCIDETTESWDEMFGRAKNLDSLGAIESLSAVDTKLQNWCNRQRYQYAKGILRQDRIRRLESIHFVWAIRRSGQDFLDDLRMIAEANHGKLLLTEWKGVHVPHRFSFHDGREFEMAPSNLKANGWPKDPDAYFKMSAKLAQRPQEHLNALRRIADANRGKVLSTGWMGNKIPHRFAFADGREFEMAPNALKSYGWPKDADAYFKKSDGRTKSNEELLDEIRAIAEANGGKLLSTEWLGGNVPHRFAFKDGREFEMRPKSLKDSRQGWPKDADAYFKKSAGMLKEEEEKLDELRAKAEANGGKLLSTEWSGNKIPHRFAFADGREFEMTPDSVKANGWPKDPDAYLKTGNDHLNKLRAIADANGGKLLSTEWKGATAKYRFAFADGREFEMQAHKMKGRGWPKDPDAYFKLIAERKRSPKEFLNDLREIAEANGGKLLSNQWEGVAAEYRFVLADGHQFEMTANQIKRKTGGWPKKYGNKSITTESPRQNPRDDQANTDAPDDENAPSDPDRSQTQRRRKRRP